MLQRQFSLCDIPVFAENFCCVFEIVRHVAERKWPQCSVSPSGHCSCKLSPLQNKDEPLKTFEGALSNFCDFHASIRFVCTGLRTFPATCANAVHTKGHVTRGNFSCNLSRNDDDWKTLQVVEGVSHVRNIFSQLATPRKEIVYDSFSASLKSPTSKRRAIIA